jgi:molybdopterin-guanine dinucleotide biosynthesis protein A
MPEPISAILLAGGKSSRMGRDKARLKLSGDREMLQVIAGKLALLSDDVIVSTDGRKYEDIGAPVRWAKDEKPGAGSLMGLYSGLKEARYEYALVAACDMPFLNVGLLRYMISLPRDYCILAPKVGDKVETLHAIYSKDCLPWMAELLEAGHLRINDLFSIVPVRYLSLEELDRFDPEHRSFFNINSPGQLEEAKKIIGRG